MQDLLSHKNLHMMDGIDMSIKKSLVIAALVVCAASYIAGCSTDLVKKRPSASTNFIKFSHGSADTPEGKNLIVTVLASDFNYSWDLSKRDDIVRVSNMKKYMGIAVDYIEDAARKYGKEAEFIYDYDENIDLMYQNTFDINLETENYDEIDDALTDYIENNVPVDELIDKYKAGNVVFMIAMNTDEKNKSITCTNTWYQGTHNPYETILMYYVDEGEVNPPAVYAHEILHAYGAPDLYTADEEYGIDKNFLLYVEKNMDNDIMYVCSDIKSSEYVYDRITNDFSELDAYYVGLSNSSKVVTENNLQKSQH